MTGVEGAGAAKKPRKARPQKKKPTPIEKEEKRAKKPSSDRIEHSDAAAQLTGKAGKQEGSRAARIEAARLRLKSGALESPEAYRKAAENLLRSGDLRSSEEGED